MEKPKWRRYLASLTFDEIVDFYADTLERIEKREKELKRIFVQTLLVLYSLR